MSEALKKRDNPGDFVKGDERCWRDATPSSFKPGYDPRRERKKTTLVELTRTYTDEAVQCIVDIMRDQKASHATKLNCAKELLLRGHGQPQSANLLALNELSEDDYKKLSKQQIVELLAADSDI